MLVPLTSVLKEDKFSIVLTNDDLQSGDLIKISRVRVDKIFCASKRLVIAKIGIIRSNSFLKIKELIEKVF